MIRDEKYDPVLGSFSPARIEAASSEIAFSDAVVNDLVLKKKRVSDGWDGKREKLLT